jgi:regulatory protein
VPGPAPGSAKDPARAAYDRALAALGRRSHSACELRESLSRKGFSAEAVEGALAGLAREGWIDDARFAAEFVASRARRGVGRARIRAELAARGVAGEVAAAALAGGYPAEDEAQRAVEAARKKRRSITRPGREGDAALARFLRGRGFSPGAIARALGDREKESIV